MDCASEAEEHATTDISATPIRSEMDEAVFIRIPRKWEKVEYRVGLGYFAEMHELLANKKHVSISLDVEQVKTIFTMR
jgi:hypothetical protein